MIEKHVPIVVFCFIFFSCLFFSLISPQILTHNLVYVHAVSSKV